MAFRPVAIVGRGCVLPGALDPDSLFRSVLAGRDLVTPAPEGRWRLDRDLALAGPGMPWRDRTWSDRGGYVTGFEPRFDPTGLRLPAEEVLALDPLVQWALHAAREALKEARRDPAAGAPGAGIILGNLSFPSGSLAELAEGVWLRSQKPSRPLDRFMSGLPAHLVAAALGLGGEAFALDAACASSLYALKLACDRLQDGSADLMLAGAVCRADDLFIHVGFTALQALSRSGRSRPFHRDADGLIPAEGAAVVALRRLEDAVAAGERVYGVIRGIGLGNDGRGAGFLAPAEEGQVRAMRVAYAMAGLGPSDVSLIECHATGTAIGDATEIRSTARVFEGCQDVPIGSLKSNLGHLITAAGAAALLKVLGAFEAGVRPPTLHAEAPLAVLADSPFRLLTEPEPWEASGPRRAAVSAFGFGGNNAHLIVEEWKGRERPGPVVAVGALPRRDPVLAVVGVGAAVAGGHDGQDLLEALLGGEPRLEPGPGGLAGAAREVRLEAEGLRFPPRDLEQALPQQLLMLAAARDAVAQAPPLPRESTAVLVGMQCDPEVARYGARWRLAQTARESGRDESWLAAARDAVCPPLESAGVLGTMPNLVANRLNSQLDLGGPSFSVSSEERSGLVALELAARALGAGEIDAAVVGAVDLSSEAVQAAAAAAVLPEDRRRPGDAAVALVVKRLADAERDGDVVHAVIGEEVPGTLRLGDGEGAKSLASLFGHAHAAAGLVHLVAGVACLRHGLWPRPGKPGNPWLPARGRRGATVTVEALGGQRSRAVIADRPGSPPASAWSGPVPRLYAFSGPDRETVGRALASRSESLDGPARLVIVAGSEDERRDRFEMARLALASADEVAGEGLHFRERPLEGELAFVFTGPAGAFRGMGRELLLAAPSLADGLGSRFAGLAEAASWVYGRAEGEPAAVEKLWGASFLCQIHAELSLRRLGLTPPAVLGFCSGETNALFALGAWSDIDGLRSDIDAAGVYDRELAGRFDTVRRAWKLGPDADLRWASFRVLAPVEAVARALQDEARAHLTIVNAPADVVIAGEAAACDRVLGRVGRERARPLGYDLAIHCPEAAAFSETWRRVHHRPTRPIPGVRFYTHATLAAYTPTADTAADALLGQAVRTVDFPALVERAWDDGVRIFVEHGPQSGCSRWIGKTLGAREHAAVALDVAGRSSLEQAAEALARLLSLGVPIDPDAAHAVWAPPPSRRAGRPGRQLIFPAHPPLPRPPDAWALEEEEMLRAPDLPPALEPGATPIGAPRAAESRSARLPPVLEELVAQQARLASVHRKYLEQQAAAHQRFLQILGDARPGRRAPGSSASTAPPPSRLARPRLDREQLLLHASGRISDVFGPLFRRQDGFRRQVRMPEPPLLLADRVTRLEGEPGSMGLGSVSTETDVTRDAWYLHEGRMPAGIMIESGQADLLLISWLGIDFLNQGERVYRLLGCELTYHGGLPRAGETLRYDIHVDGHARQGEVRLFFFHYECRVAGEPRLTVRGGQAGFFSDEELGETGGVIWDPRTGERTADPSLEPPLVAAVPRSLTATQIDALCEGRLSEALGGAFARAETHVATPRVPGGRLRLLQEVTDLDPRGGPWGRGYLRAVWRFSPDDWFFAGHFKDDPCMPGTLMFEGCLEAMALYLSALGFTLDKDGWRFEPVPEAPYRLRCRGQASPASRELVYELFVDELSGAAEPTLWADLLCTVDGVKAFHCRRMGLKLVPDWPLTRRPRLLPEAALPPPSRIVPGTRFDQAAVLAAAWGAPSAAMGPLYAAFDGPRRLPRLPAPPYQFLSRVRWVEGEAGSPRPGATIEAEYDVPPDAWYFDDQDAMPFAVFLEVLLQPCGWLSLASGIPLASAEDLFYRNLDGTATVRGTPGRDAGTLRTRVRLDRASASAGMHLVGFEVTAWAGEAELFRLETGFGFFPEVALRNQAGLGTSDEEREWLERPGQVPLDLDEVARRAREAGLALAAGRLGMIDRITGYWPEAGRSGLGRLRAEKDVSPSDWFFKAHFYQDPVQPGSLGLEAMLQLLRIGLVERGLHRELERPRFLPILPDRPFSWKYRGQVLPARQTVTLEAEILEAGRDQEGALLAGDAWLSVDGCRIYEARGLGVGVLSGQ